MKKIISKEMQRDMNSRAYRAHQAEEATPLAKEGKMNWKQASSVDTTKFLNPRDFYPDVIVGTPLEEETNSDLPIVKGVPEPKD